MIVKLLLAVAFALMAALAWMIRGLLRASGAPARARKEDEQRDAVAKLEPGGGEDRALTVDSASIVEPRALALGCARCEGELRLEDHRVAPGADTRVVVGKCKRCATLREIYVRITAVH